VAWNILLLFSNEETNPLSMRTYKSSEVTCINMNHQRHILIAVIHTSLKGSVAVLVLQSDTEQLPQDNGVNAVKATVSFSGSYVYGFLSMRTCTEFFM